MGGPVDVDLAQWRRMAGLLKVADKKVAAGMRKGLRRAAMPIAEEVVLRGAAQMPRRGGLADYLAANARPTVSLTGSNIAIRLQDRHGVKLRALDNGVLRHPLFGNRKDWFLQKVPQHAWTNAFLARRDDMLAVVTDQIKQSLADLEGAPSE